MQKEFNFTEASLKTLLAPEKGRVYYKDAKEKGLSLYITASGTITFFVRKRINGKDERIILGNFPTMNVIKARKEALNAKALAAKGESLNSHKNKIRNENTFKELFDRYINDYAKLHTKTWRIDIEEVNRNLSSWFNKKISTITPNDVRKLHANFGRTRGQQGANRLLNRINAVFNKAIEWGWDGKNPGTGIQKFKTQSRDRFLQANEFPALFEALSTEENTIARDYILIALLTGARKSNTLSMEWKEIDLENSVWRIPEEKTKNSDPIFIPLTQQAMDILKSRKKANPRCPFVFPGTGQTGHLADPKKTWKRVCKAATIKIWEKDEELVKLIQEARKNLAKGALTESLYERIHKLAVKKKITLPTGLTDVRIHDLRRTLGSWQAATGATTAIIGKSLGHKSPRATAIYERLNIDPVRASLERATEAMFNTRKP